MEILLNSTHPLHCYKHNGKIHRTWDEVTILDETEDYLVCGNNKVRITESDGRSHKTKETAIIFLYKHRWFHVTAQFKNTGLYYKVDMASPFLIDGNILKYIDYDLDLKVFPDGEYRVLDRNEYKFHKKIMKYSENLDFILQKELTNVIELKKSEEGPFNKKYVEEYYQKFLNLKEKCTK